MRLAVVLAAACGSPAHAVVSNTAHPQPSTLVLRMERTECFGNACPVYAVDIASDGSVIWHGGDQVAVVGDARGQISVDNVHRLIAAFEAAKFFDLKDPQPRFVIQYVNGKPVTVICSSTDVPSTKVTIIRDGKPYTHEYQACVDALDRADKLVDEVVGTGRWIGPRVSR